VEKGGTKGYMTGVEDAAENGKESSHSAHANGMNEWNCKERPAYLPLYSFCVSDIYLMMADLDSQNML
jgi:hypothetical protein